ncbi:MAG: hypothetical protein EPN94_09670 [Nitrospirae bacterium]|nr:MAG: hypothetical protein EPN94_09670 [Nitrospirota bacterium]
MVSGKRGLVKSKKFIALYIIIVVLSAFSFYGTAHAQLDCKKCHKHMTTKKFVHTALQMGCEACHTEPHQKNSKFPKGLSAAAPDLCYGCHDKAKFTKKNIHPPVAGGMCSGCHDPHTSDNAKLLLASGSELCFMCHDKKNFSGKKILHPPVSGGMCPSCHAPHSSDSEKLLLSAQPGLCLICHDKAKFENKIVHAPVAGGMCTSCHFPHQGDSEKLLMASQPDLCYNCHDKTEFTKKNVHAAVMMGCTSCHSPHASKQRYLFDKAINNLCLTCHADVAKNPHAISSFAAGAAGHKLRGRRVRKEGKIEVGKDPARPDKEFSCSSCHNPHSSDSIKLFRYKVNTAMEMCINCHKM